MAGRELEVALGEARDLFKILDVDQNGAVSKIELIKGLRTSQIVRDFFGLPAKIRQEDAASRKKLEYIFQSIDTDESKSISWEELEAWIIKNPERWQSSEKDQTVPDSKKEPNSDVAERTGSSSREKDQTAEHTSSPSREKDQRAEQTSSSSRGEKDQKAERTGSPSGEKDQRAEHAGSASREKDQKAEHTGSPSREKDRRAEYTGSASREKDQKAEHKDSRGREKDQTAPLSEQEPGPKSTADAEVSVEEVRDDEMPSSSEAAVKALITKMEQIMKLQANAPLALEPEKPTAEKGLPMSREQRLSLIRAQQARQLELEGLPEKMRNMSPEDTAKWCESLALIGVRGSLLRELQDEILERQLDGPKFDAMLRSNKLMELDLEDLHTRLAVAIRRSWNTEFYESEASDPENSRAEVAVLEKDGEEQVHSKEILALDDGAVRDEAKMQEDMEREAMEVARKAKEKAMEEEAERQRLEQEEKKKKEQEEKEKKEQEEREAEEKRKTEEAIQEAERLFLEDERKQKEQEEREAEEKRKKEEEEAQTIHPADLADLAGNLHHPVSPQARWAATAVMGSLGKAAGDFGHASLGEAACNPKYDAFQRMRATQALGNSGSEIGAKALAKSLLREDNDWYLRCGAAGSLGHLGESAGKVGVLALGRAVQTDSHTFVRRQAATSLGEIGPDAGVRSVERAAVPALSNALRQDPDVTVRWRACESLAKLGDLAGDAGVAAVAEALREDTDLGTRWRAADALGVLGDIAGDVGTAALVKAMQCDRSEMVRDQSSAALEKVQEISLSVLRSSEHEYVRGRAASALGELGTLAKQAAVEVLVRVLFSDDVTYVRRRVCDALGRLGLACGEVGAAALAKASVEDADVFVQCKAGELLEGLKSAGDAGQAALAKVLKGEEVDDSSLFTHIDRSVDALYGQA